MKLDKNLFIGLAIGAGLAIMVPMMLNKKTSTAHLAFRHRRRFHPFHERFLPYPYFIPPYPYPIHRRHIPFGFGEGLYETPIL